MIGKEWRKSSYSAHQDCVEVRAAEHNTVQVRDSKDPEGGSITFSASEWDAFIAGAKAGEFNLPPGAYGPNA